DGEQRQGGLEAAGAEGILAGGRIVKGAEDEHRRGGRQRCQQRSNPRPFSRPEPEVSENAGPEDGRPEDDTAPRGEERVEDSLEAEAASDVGPSPALGDIEAR